MVNNQTTVWHTCNLCAAERNLLLLHFSDREKKKIKKPAAFSVSFRSQL